MYCLKEPKKIKKFLADQEQEQKAREAKEQKQQQAKAANRLEVREAFERVGLVLDDGSGLAMGTGEISDPFRLELYSTP